jgi:hypothetical protein
MKSIFILLIIAISCKGGDQAPPTPTVAKNCQNSIKTDYHSYFDSVEKCIEIEADIKKMK